MMHPMTAGSVHTRVNTRWDLATVIRYLEGELGYKGLYTIEASNGHRGHSRDLRRRRRDARYEDVGRLLRCLGPESEGY